MFAKVVALTAVVAFAEAVELKSEACPLMAAMQAQSSHSHTPTVSSSATHTSSEQSYTNDGADPWGVGSPGGM